MSDAGVGALAPAVTAAAPTSAGPWHRLGPVAVLIAALLLVWYAAAIGLNAPQVSERLDNLGNPWGARELIAGTWAMERPVLPAPHQIVAEFWGSLVEHDVDSPRNLLFHAGVTLTATLLGFGLGLLLGVAIAIGVVHRWPAGKAALRFAGAMVALAGLGFLWRAFA